MRGCLGRILNPNLRLSLNLSPIGYLSLSNIVNLSIDFVLFLAFILVFLLLFAGISMREIVLLLALPLLFE